MSGTLANKFVDMISAPGNSSIFAMVATQVKTDQIFKT